MMVMVDRKCIAQQLTERFYTKLVCYGSNQYSVTNIEMYFM